MALGLGFGFNRSIRRGFKNRKYCTFNGINQYITCGKATELHWDKPFTIVIIYKASELDNYHFMASYGTTSSGLWFGLENNNRIMFYIASPDGSGGVNWFHNRTSNSFSDSNQHIVFYTYNGVTNNPIVNIYVDKNSIEPMSHGDISYLVNDFYNNSTGVYIGGLNGTNQPFSGSLDEFAIINRVLSESDIAKIIGNQSGDFDPTKIGDIVKIAGSDLDMYYHLGDKATYNGSQWTFPNVANPSYPGTSQNMIESNVEEY